MAHHILYPIILMQVVFHVTIYAWLARSYWLFYLDMCMPWGGQYSVLFLDIYYDLLYSGYSDLVEGLVFWYNAWNISPKFITFQNSINRVRGFLCRHKIFAKSGTQRTLEVYILATLCIHRAYRSSRRWETL